MAGNKNSVRAMAEANTGWKSIYFPELRGSAKYLIEQADMLIELGLAFPPQGKIAKYHKTVLYLLDTNPNSYGKELNKKYRDKELVLCWHAIIQKYVALPVDVAIALQHNDVVYYEESSLNDYFKVDYDEGQKNFNTIMREGLIGESDAGLYCSLSVVFSERVARLKQGLNQREDFGEKVIKAAKEHWKNRMSERGKTRSKKNLY